LIVMRFADEPILHTSTAAKTEARKRFIGHSSKGL
jgi:hypothetical protein